MFIRMKNFLLLLFILQNTLLSCNENTAKIKIPCCSLKLSNKSLQTFESFFNIIKFFTMFGAFLGGINGINKSINLNINTNESLLNQLKFILNTKSIESSKDILKGGLAGACTGTIFAFTFSLYLLLKKIFTPSNKLNNLEIIEDARPQSQSNYKHRESTQNCNEEYYEEDDNF
jgi:hypothetical protein